MPECAAGLQGREMWPGEFVASGRANAHAGLFDLDLQASRYLFMHDASAKLDKVSTVLLP